MSRQSKASEEMIIHLFEVSGKEIKPTRHCYALKFLKDIIDAFPEKHMDMLKYLFYMTCPDPVNNPYFNINPIIRETKIIRDNNMHFSTEEDLILIALEKCEELYKTPTIKAHEAIRGLVENMMDFMGTQKWEGGKNGNVNQFIKIAKDFDDLKEKYLNTTKELHQEQKIHGKKGGGQLAYDLRDDSTRDDD